MADKEKVNNKHFIQKYNNLTKEELIERLIKLENGAEGKTSGKIRQKKKFKWEGVSKRHILLKFMYFGWDYHGFASQPDDNLETIEKHLFAALKTCCLIDERETSNYHRCGRTDAGVSAFSQVISIDVRSKLKEPDTTNVSVELPYCKMLNRLLPRHIRCYAWCHVASEVSSRFDCTERCYNYFFPCGDLDIPAMKTAVQLLIGSHDFRNLCKMDVGNGVVEFQRTINFADIVPVTHTHQSSGYTMMKLVIRSRGFLWHQIRCIMAVLLAVGEGDESPNIVAQLLDVEANPCKPQYLMASPLPLSLTSVEYGGLEMSWHQEETETEVLAGQLRDLWTEYTVKSCMVKETLELLNEMSPSAVQWKRQLGLYSGKVPKEYTPLLSRQTCLSLVDRIQNVERRKNKGSNDLSEGEAKKQKIVTPMEV